MIHSNVDFEISHKAKDKYGRQEGGNKVDTVHESLFSLLRKEWNWVCSLMFPTKENPEGVDIIQCTDVKYEKKQIFLDENYNRSTFSYKLLKEDIMNAALNSGTKIHVRGKGEFLCFTSRIYVSDKQ
eukprot:15341131-Ditylum_brightwellii.AAC.1